MLRKHTASEPALHINEINVYDKYEFLKKIGKGSYGEVWLVIPINSSSIKSRTKQYILKRLDFHQSSSNPSESDIENTEREAKLLSTLKHPNIVAYNESFRSRDGFLNIVMAYCEGGDLYSKLKEKKANKELLTENQIMEWFIQICMALQCMHEKNILHRDLKTQNIFLTKNKIVKVGDLGIARVLASGNDLATTFIGTPYYMSPEIFSHKPYGQKSDIWSLGCCVYEMVTLQHAFNAKDIDGLVSKILREQTPEMPGKYSESLRNIIISMLNKNPDNRPTAKSILQDSYIKQHILRLLEKTQMKCQNPVTSNSQPIVSSASPASSPSRPSSASNSSSSKNRLPNNNTPVLPTYPGLPPSHSRPPSTGSANRAVPHTEPIQSNEPIMSDSRTRRLLHQHRNSPLSMNEREKDLKFLSNLSRNDTLQLRKRVHSKQHQPPSSSDEQDASPIRPSNDNASQPVFVIESPRSQSRPSSVESNADSSRPSSHSRVTKSYDLNQDPKPSARQRRRDNKLHSSSTEYIAPNQIDDSKNNESPRSTSQDRVMSEIEKKKEGEKDMNDLVFMLTTTLQLPPAIENGYSQNKVWSSSDRTIVGPLHETNRLQKRCDLIRENCLQEISPEKLQRVLKLAENVSEEQMKQEMIDELGAHLYHKYSAQIFSLKFYEDNLLTHS